MEKIEVAVRLRPIADEDVWRIEGPGALRLVPQVGGHSHNKSFGTLSRQTSVGKLVPRHPYREETRSMRPPSQGGTRPQTPLAKRGQEETPQSSFDT